MRNIEVLYRTEEEIGALKLSDYFGPVLCQEPGQVLDSPSQQGAILAPFSL